MDNDNEEVESVFDETVAVPKFSIKTVLRQTFSVFRKNPLLYLAIALLVKVPSIVRQLFWPVESAQGLGDLIPLLIASLIASLISLIFVGAIAYIVYNGLIGEQAGLIEAISLGLSRCFPLIGISVILCIFAVAIVLMGVLMKLVGILIALVAMIYLVCIFMVATPACVVERLDPIASLKRSAALTEGCRGSVFGLFIITGIGGYVGNTVSKGVFAINSMVGGIVENAIAIILIALIQIGISVLYFQLRATKEGVSISELDVVQ